MSADMSLEVTGFTELARAVLEWAMEKTFVIPL